MEIDLSGLGAPPGGHMVVAREAPGQTLSVSRSHSALAYIGTAICRLRTVAPVLPSWLLSLCGLLGRFSTVNRPGSAGPGPSCRRSRTRNAGINGATIDSRQLPFQPEGLFRQECRVSKCDVAKRQPEFPQHSPSSPDSVMIAGTKIAAKPRPQHLAVKAASKTRAKMPVVIHRCRSGFHRSLCPCR